MQRSLSELVHTTQLHAWRTTLYPTRSDAELEMGSSSEALNQHEPVADKVPLLAQFME